VPILNRSLHAARYHAICPKRLTERSIALPKNPIEPAADVACHIDGLAAGSDQFFLQSLQFLQSLFSVDMNAVHLDEVRRCLYPGGENVIW
jgi:hypothetical protein